MLTVHTPIPGSLSFTRSLSPSTYMYFYLFPRALRKTLSFYIASLHGEEEDDDDDDDEIGRERNLLLCRSNQRGGGGGGGDGQFHRRGENTSPSGRKRTGDYSSLLSHPWTRPVSTPFSPSSEASSSVARPDTQTPTTRHPPRFFFFFFTTFFFHKKKKKRKKS